MLLLSRVQPSTFRVVTRLSMSARFSSSHPAYSVACPYPSVRRDEKTSRTYKSETRGEVIVPEPYIWLHEPPSKSKETAKFVQDQADYTAKYLSQNKNLDTLKDLITKNWNYARFSPPSLKGDGKYYYSYNSGLQAQSVLYSTTPDKLGSGTDGDLFFDPNLLSEDGTAALSTMAFSKSGKYFAYGISRSGSDWVNIYVRRSDSPHNPNQDKGKDDGKLDDLVRYVKFSGIAWTHDDKGFFYQRYPAASDHGSDQDDKAGTETDQDVNAKLYYHRIGTSQSEDTLIIEDPENPTHMFGGSITHDGRYLVLHTSKDTGRTNKLWITDLQEPINEIGSHMKWHKVVDTFKSEYSVVANDGSKMYIKTNADGNDRDHIVVYDLENPEKGFVEHIPQDPVARLTDVHITNSTNALLIYSRDVNDEMWLYDLPSGKCLRRIDEKFIGSVGYVTGRHDDTEFWVYVSGFTSPGMIYRYQFGTPEGQEYSLFKSTVVPGLNPKDFSVKQIFYNSKDGTRVPMFIVTPTGIKHDGTAPAITYGYGGFDISIDPFFSPSMMTFLKAYGAILAVPSLRGGGEYGEQWHQGGVKERKQNVFDDAIAAIQYLVDNKIAAHKKVAISGGSNGGLLVGACVNQAPELIGAGIADVGVMDMLNFHRFTIGSAWQSDYGNPDDPHDFDFLYKYSPLHNIDATKEYPPVMLLTGDHDDRVVPLHSFKLAAALQYALPNNPNPLLLRVDLKAGHGAGKSTMARIQEATDKWGFVAQSLGLEMRK